MKRKNEQTLKQLRATQQNFGLLDSSEESQESIRPITSVSWKKHSRMAPQKASILLQVVAREIPQPTPEAHAYMESNQMNLDATCLYSFAYEVSGTHLL